jgi:hypothetical protein
MDEKMKKVCFILFFVWSNLSIASVDCPKTKVENIQIEGEVILVNYKDQSWHLLGNINTVGTKERYSALLAAQMSGKSVQLRYPDGYNCVGYDLSIPAIMVRTFND